MQGFTSAETAKAIELGGPGTGFSIAIAELNRYWDNHPKHRPEPGNEPVISIHVPHGTDPLEGVATVHEFAEWAGVTTDYVYGTYIAKAHYGPPGRGVYLERHFTPDHDAAYALRLQAGEAA